MTASLDELYTKFVTVSAETTLSQALAQHPEITQDIHNVQYYLVIQLPDGKFVSLLVGEILKTLNSLGTQSAKAGYSNTALGQLFAHLATPAADIDDPNFWPALQPWRGKPSGSMVVLSGGQAVGVLPVPVVFREGSMAEMPTTSGGVLADEGGPEASPEKRINIQMLDADYKPCKPEEKPLQLSQSYTLVFDISDEARTGSLVSDAFFKYQWTSGEKEVKLTVRLESDDFDILTDPQRISVPRVGESNKARFDLRPRKEGRGVVNVLLFKDDLFIQLITLKFTVVDGELFSKETAGKALGAAFSAEPRSLSLTILEATGGFQLIMTGTVAATCRLPITREALASRIQKLRKVIQDQVVYYKDPAGNLVYQQNFKIEPAYRDQVLPALAEAGYRMYREIFYSLDADEQANQLGDRLREITRGGEKLKLQIFSQHFMMPWGLMYMASEDEFDVKNVHPEWFLGLSHIIEHIPLQQTMQVTSPKMDSRAGFTVSLNVNRAIDEQMNVPLVAEQIKFWEGIKKGGGVQLVMRDTADALVTALRSTEHTDDQVLYFYCHASSKDLSEGGADASTLVFGPKDKLTLGNLRLNASHKKILPGEPLVFINACESAELSPLAYDGFVPYFIAKGARGVIGTECEVPAVFAREWAKRFFTRFLAGERLGEIVLDLRQQFFKEENNIVGLLYALYVDSDTRVEPAIPA